MKIRVLAILALCVLVLNLSGSTLADTKKAKTISLVDMLPAVDGVATFDAKRFFADALPTLLSANQPVLNEITAHIDKITQLTGVDLRKFDEVAAGFSVIPRADGKFTFNPILIARGDVNATTALSAAKSAIGENIREETINGRTIFIVSAQTVAEKHKSATDAATAKKADDTMDSLPRELAMTAVDGNTIVVGEPALVRKSLAGDTKPSIDLTSLLYRKPGQIASFAFKPPTGLAKLLPLDDDDLGANISSISHFFGGMSVTPANASISLNVKTLTEEQASGLFETLAGLKFVGEKMLAKSTDGQNQIFARLLSGAKIGNKTNEVSLDIQIAKKDLDALAVMIKLPQAKVAKDTSQK